MGLFDLKKNKFKKVKQNYWNSKSRIPLPFQRNDDDDISFEEKVNILKSDGKKAPKEVQEAIKLQRLMERAGGMSGGLKRMKQIREGRPDED